MYDVIITVGRTSLCEQLFLVSKFARNYCRARPVSDS